MLPTASLTIAQLFSNPYLLNVPIYQRAYSWDGGIAEQLFDDLFESLNFAREDQDDPGYFLGTILLMDAAGEPSRLSPKSAPREFDIVDGQQRIVTLMTLFCVLRDLESAQRGPLAKRTLAMVTAQIGTRFFGAERHRLHLDSADRSFFETYILQPGATALRPAPEALSEPETALLAARDAMRTQASSLTPAERSALYAYVADRCHVVVIVSYDVDRAYRMFVVLNERGKRLQRNDILKADVLSRVPASAIAASAATWDQVSAELGEDFEGFFAHVRAIYGYPKPQIVSGVRAVIDEAGGAEKFLANVFLPLSKSFLMIRRAGADLPPDIARRLVYLNRLPDGDWAPAAMLALKNWRDDPARAEMLIAEIDRFAHLIRLLCAGSSKRIRRFSIINDAIRSGEAIGPKHSSFQFTREEQRSIAFHLRDLHKRAQKVCKLLLLRLNDEIAGEVKITALEAYTIEHVLPQRTPATSEWRKWFPSPEERGDCVDSLGNLVLITKAQNEMARNASWAEKRKIYAKSSEPLVITRDVLTSETWRRADIEAREDKLLRVLERIWRFSLPAGRASGRNAAE